MKNIIKVLILKLLSRFTPDAITFAYRAGYYCGYADGHQWKWKPALELKPEDLIPHIWKIRDEYIFRTVEELRTMKVISREEPK